MCPISFSPRNASHNLRNSRLWSFWSIKRLTCYDSFGCVRNSQSVSIRATAFNAVIKRKVIMIMSLGNEIKRHVYRTRSIIAAYWLHMLILDRRRIRIDPHGKCILKVSNMSFDRSAYFCPFLAINVDVKFLHVAQVAGHQFQFLLLLFISSFNELIDGRTGTI